MGIAYLKCRGHGCLQFWYNLADWFVGIIIYTSLSSRNCTAPMSIRLDFRARSRPPPWARTHRWWRSFGTVRLAWTSELGCCPGQRLWRWRADPRTLPTAGGTFPPPFRIPQTFRWSRRYGRTSWRSGYGCRWRSSDRARPWRWRLAGGTEATRRVGIRRSSVHLSCRASWPAWPPRRRRSRPASWSRTRCPSACWTPGDQTWKMNTWRPNVEHNVTWTHGDQTLNIMLHEHLAIQC